MWQLRLAAGMNIMAFAVVVLIFDFYILKHLFCNDVGIKRHTACDVHFFDSIVRKSRVQWRRAIIVC